MEKNKVVRITRDYRLAVIATVRSIALLGLLALAVFSVWRYRDDFNEASAKQLVAYMKSASYSDVLFEEYKTDSGLDTTFAPLGVGMAVVESDIYNYVAGSNRVEFSSQLRYAKPVIKSQDDWALIYDQGSTGYSVVTGYAITKQGEALGTIITGAVSQSGSYAIVSKSPGYRSSITVFSKKHKQLCSWETPSEYIMMATVSPNGQRFATVSISSDGQNMVYRLVGRNSNTGEMLFQKQLGVSELYSLRHTEDGKLMMLSDSGIIVMDYNGQEKASIALPDRELLSFCHYEQDDCLVIYRGSQVNTLMVQVYDKSGGIIYSEELNGVFRACDYRRGNISVLLDTSLIWHGPNGTKTVEGISARDVISMNNGTPVLVFSNRIERVFDDALQLDS